ncbi:hypothetical protein Q5O14_02100 [Eubacteriaceae bacterium ES2]|nr:hypothetical protein Q5O14_02100 [Eubacteriaceae bacterium ES2]
MKARWLVLSATTIFILMIVGIPECRSDTALFIQSLLLNDQNILKSSGLELIVPTAKTVSGSQWDETMKSFQPGQDFPHGATRGRMSILYNFGDFEKGHSTFYDPEADTYNAHYGVYAIQLDEGIFGLKDGQVDFESITRLVAYDQLNLVMASLGCPRSQCVFDSKITATKDNIAMAGFDDWTQIDAKIITNSPLHQKTAFKQGYLQYGQPPQNYQGKDFPFVDMAGRLYLRYDVDVNLTIIYFVVAKNEEIVAETSQDYLIPIQWIKAEEKE